MTETVGQVIKRLRVDKGLKMRELERATGVSQPYLSQIESTVRHPSPEVLSKIAPVLKVSKLYLYKAAGYLDETDILKLVDENKRLREALEQIANHGFYTSIEVMEIARKALEGGEKE